MRIDEYALIGDRSAALAGRRVIALAAAITRTERRYRRDSLVLETELRTPEGWWNPVASGA